MADTPGPDTNALDVLDRLLRAVWTPAGWSPMSALAPLAFMTELGAIDESIDA